MTHCQAMICEREFRMCLKPTYSPPSPPRWLRNSQKPEFLWVQEKSYILMTIEPPHLCDITHCCTFTWQKNKLWCCLNYYIFVCVSLCFSGFCMLSVSLQKKRNHFILNRDLIQRIGHLQKH